MATHPLAGKRVPPEQLIDAEAIDRAYRDRTPDAADPAQLVAFGTSGHRGSALDGSFNEAHILAASQAICDYRKSKGIDGPLFMGMDSHAVSAAAQQTALEVLCANGVDVVIQPDGGVTPTPVISRAILAHNRGRRERLADGIVVTPSHNPPRDGGFKYNAVDGGPAGSEITGWVQDRANALLKAGNREVRRTAQVCAREEDFALPYVRDLSAAVDMEAIRASGLRIGVDPLGGAAVRYWGLIAEQHRLDITVVNDKLDPAFAFMTADHDGKIRMDCSSPYAMAGLVGLKDKFDIAFGNDTDVDRHGIVTRSVGLMNPNHYLAAAISYLIKNRPRWPAKAVIGKTLVSSSLIDRVAAKLGRTLWEVPVGFKWFVPGLLDGSCCFGGEESAGASFLRRDGTVWTTDKDGLILGLLAAEMTAREGKDPGEQYLALAKEFGTPYYVRIDAPASPEQKKKLAKLSPEAVSAESLAGEPIAQKLTRAPGNDAPIGGLKVVTKNGWFAARPSGTENIYKLYAESLKSQAHLDAIVEEARSIVSSAL